jgi:hypothetical protein
MQTFAAPEDGLVSLRTSACAAEITLRVQHVEAGARCIAAVAGAPDALLSCRWMMPHAEPAPGASKWVAASIQRRVSFDRGAAM